MAVGGMQWVLRDDGWKLGLRRIRHLMRELGLSPIRLKRRTGEPNPTYQKHAYLLRDRAIESTDEIWDAADLQHRPGIAVHEFGVSERVAAPWHRHQCGW